LLLLLFRSSDEYDLTLAVAILVPAVSIALALI
jgi:hypothetical protein